MDSDNTERSILIVDDDPDTRAIVSSAVEMMGCHPIEAVDGAAAVALVGQTHFDVAVLDLMMPGLNGNEVCVHIKSSQGGQLIPVIMLTARDNLKDKVDSLDGGADDYLTKPFHYQELQARIRALLRVRDLNLALQQKNLELQSMQQQLVEKERQIVVSQLAGTAAHQLGQPLAAIMLNCHLLETLPPNDERWQKALAATKLDAKRMAELIEKLKVADAKKTEGYYGQTAIFDLEKKS